MSGNKTGGQKAAAKNLEKNPNFYKEIGRKGGSNGHTGGFAADPHLAKLAGSIGGKVSRRGIYKTESEKQIIREKIYKELGLIMHTH